MTDATADVDKEGRIGLNGRKKLSRKRCDVEPIPIARNAHELLEPLELVGMLLRPGEEAEVGIHALVPCQFAVGRLGLILDFLQVIWEGLIDWSTNAEAIAGVSTNIYRPPQREKTKQACHLRVGDAPLDTRIS